MKNPEHISNELPDEALAIIRESQGLVLNLSAGGSREKFYHVVEVVGYAISRSMDARIAVAALKAAIRNRVPATGCIHHSVRQLDVVQPQGRTPKSGQLHTSMSTGLSHIRE
jgi:hypothetical protein